MIHKYEYWSPTRCLIQSIRLGARGWAVLGYAGLCWATLIYLALQDWMTLLFWTLNVPATLTVGYTDRGETIMKPHLGRAGGVGGRCDQPLGSRVVWNHDTKDCCWIMTRGNVVARDEKSFMFVGNRLESVVRTGIVDLKMVMCVITRNCGTPEASPCYGQANNLQGVHQWTGHIRVVATVGGSVAFIMTK
eukprot:Skav220944  [mRNA]  locus=scaffold2381:71252:71824:+ [translate_table: standard]